MLLRNANVISRGNSSRLVVVVHAWLSSSIELSYVTAAIEEALPDADLIVPDYPAQWYSRADASRIAGQLSDSIAGAFEARRQVGKAYSDIVLIGHSLGALLIRKAYVFARGQAQDRDSANPLIPTEQEWAQHVSRVILLAGTNRGWQITKRPQDVRLRTWIGFQLVYVLWRWTRLPALISSAHRGAPFIANLRVQWLTLVKDPDRPPPLTIQLLGDRDDIVSEEDNVDVQVGVDFIYKRVFETGHNNVIDFSGGIGAGRKRVFLEALLSSVLQSDYYVPLKRDLDREIVVFVMHGMRDYGDWTDRLGRRLKKAATARGVSVDYLASSYGYFPMLGFLLQPERQANVRWFMDQYTEVAARYPRASIDFVGHSNGTYLLGSALERYAACSFRRAVLFGSVLPRRFPWAKFIQDGRLKAVQNYVATKDWIVAVFPGGFEYFPGSDLGSAGHNGFTDDDAKRYEVRFLKGGHGAVLDERNFEATGNAITRFLFGDIHKDIQAELEAGKYVSHTRATLTVLAGKFCALIWLMIAAFLVIPVVAPPFLAASGYWSKGWLVPWWVVPPVWLFTVRYLLRRV